MEIEHDPYRVLMNKYPIHKNLNTSFVNFSALIRHLRGLRFVGSVRIELSSYEAEIEFGEDGTVTVSDQDHMTDHHSFGKDALARMMIRSMEPGGTINVYKNVYAGDRSVFVDEIIANSALQMIAHEPSRPVAPIFPACSADGPGRAKIGTHIPISQAAPKTKSIDKWSELLGLISELMQTVDDTMTKGNINFGDALKNACGLVSYDHPFLDPDTDVFSYSDGYISMRQRMGSQQVIDGVIAALERIMQRLREDPYGELYHQTMHRIRVLGYRRKLQFDSFGLGPKLQTITGI